MIITEQARTKIVQFLEKDKVFRISVDTGGCSGFKYNTEITDRRDDDIALLDGIAAIDPVSHDLLKNITLDYEDSIAQSGFTFDNPDATSTCGCGVSFDV